MAAPNDATARPKDVFGRALYGTAEFLAVVGGVLSCAMAVLVTVSVIGRYLFSAPVSGDYDLVGIMCGCAIFSFLPYCQLKRGNVLADFFTQRASSRTKAALDAFGNVLFLAAIVMFTWRLHYGMFEMRQSAEQIAAFAFYRWWTIPYDIFCMFVLILAIAYTLRQDIAGAKAGASSERPMLKGE